MHIGPTAKQASDASPPRTVLVVDDEAHIRTIAELILTEAGFRVANAANGVEALGLFDSSSDVFDLVILDLTMPRMGGATAFSEIRKRQPDLAILLTSGYGETEAEALLQHGSTAFLQKPFEVDDLLLSVRRLLSTTPP
ncbi:MAG: response regulator [Acidobacteriota bacterium]